jgi:hypothetical protein
MVRISPWGYYSPCKHGVQTEVAPDRLRIDALSLVTKHRASRHHSDVGQLGEAANDAFRDAVAQVFHLRVGANILEGQNGDRADGLAGPADGWHCGFRRFYRGDEAIAATGAGLHKARAVRRITQSSPQRINGCIKAAVEAYVGVGPASLA